MTERIDRLGPLNYGYNAYIQEVKKKKVSTEKIKVEIENAAEYPDHLGNIINLLR